MEKFRISRIFKVVKVGLNLKFSQNWNKGGIRVSHSVKCYGTIDYFIRAKDNY